MIKSQDFTAQRRAFFIALVTLAVTLMPFSGWASTVLVKNNDKTPFQPIGATSATWLGQAFTTGASASKLESVVCTFYNGRDLGTGFPGPPHNAANARLYLYSSSSGNVGTLLAAFFNAQLVSGYNYSFTPTSTVNLTPNTTYWLVMSSISAVDQTLWDRTLDLAYSGSGSIPASKIYADTADGGATWSYSSSIGCMMFEVDVTSPAMTVRGNGIDIADGDTSPSTADATDFGGVDPVSGSVEHTFTIANSGELALSLTGASPYVVITGDTGDFTLTQTPSSSIASGGATTTCKVKFDPTTTGLRSATISIANNSAANPYNFSIQGTGGVPEMSVGGNFIEIANGDTTPTTDDYTDFGSANVAGGTISRTFVIDNTGSANLNLTGTPKVVITGTHASDFTVTAQPSSPLAYGDVQPFTVQFDPSGTGLRSATISIANDDSDENPYTFSIQGTGTVPEMDLKQGGTAIADGGSHDFGSQFVSSNTDVVFTIENTGTASLTLTTPIIVSGANAAEFSIQAQPSSPVAASGSTTFTVRFTPTSTGVKTATISIANNDTNENPYDLTVTGTGIPLTHNITVTQSANGTISPGGTVAVTHGNNQTFSITPSTGYHVVGVTVDGSGVGPVTSYTFNNVTTTHTITATYALNTYNIAASAVANGSVSSGTPQTINHNANAAPIVFQPAANYHLVSIADTTTDYFGAGSTLNTILPFLAVNRTASYTYQLNNVVLNHTAVATFALNQYTLTASAGANGSVVSGSPQTLAHGANASGVLFRPAAGYHFVSLTDQVTDQTGATSTATVNPGLAVDRTADYTYTLTNVQGDHVLTATFAINQYGVSASSGGNGSVVSGSPQTIADGANATGILFRPAANYHLVSLQDTVTDYSGNVTVNTVTPGLAVNRTADYTYNLTSLHGAHSVVATFALNTYAITASANANGTIVSGTPQNVAHGSNAAGILIRPDAGYHFVSLTDQVTDQTGATSSSTVNPGLAVDLTADYTYSLTNVQGDHVITATFAINQYTITPTAGANGSISPDTPQTVTHGDSQGFTITPNSGYHVADVLVDGSSVGAVTNYTFTNVTANHTIAASFDCSADTTVTSAADSGAGSLREAIAYACDGGTITFSDNLTIVLASQLTIDKNLTIDGVGHGVTVSGDNATRVFYVNSGVTCNLQNLTVVNGRIDDHNNNSNGGGISNNGTLAVTNVALLGNYAGSGAGIYSHGPMTVTNCTFSGNRYGFGCGIYNDNSTMTVTNSTFSGNGSIGVFGGGIFNYNGTLTVTGSTFTGNTAFDGGGISNSGTLTVANCTFSGNSANGEHGGGAIENRLNATATVTNSTFSGNSASGVGGGICNDGMLTATNCTFSGNSATYTGGGLYCGNTENGCTVVNSTFSGNSAATSGGGLSCESAETGNACRVINSTFSGNSAATSGGGIYVTGNGATVSNTIIAGSTGGNCSGTIVGGTNLADDSTCGENFTNSPTILLGPLGDNGGPTQTVPLLAGSSAIDAGDDAVCAAPPVDNLDQRGVARPQGSGCDIGAFELADTTPPDTTIDSTDPPASPTSSTAITFTFSGTDEDSGVKSFECDLDGAGFSACTSPKAYSGLAYDNHTFRVRAIDFVGNVDPTPATYTWAVQTTPATDLQVIPPVFTKVLFSLPQAALKDRSHDGICNEPDDCGDGGEGSGPDPAGVIALLRLLGFTVPLQPCMIIGDKDTVFGPGDRPVWSPDSLQTVFDFRLGKRVIIALVFINPLTAHSGTYTVSIGEWTGTVQLVIYN